MIDEQFVIDLLRSNVCDITFEKADKSIRPMVGTLKSEYITKTSAGERKHTPGLIVVWDVEKEDYRSFRMDRLINISPRNF